MADVHGVPVWPGLVAPASFSYTLSHGITPGIALLTTLPQAYAPAMSGSLSFADGVHGQGITLPFCKVNKITSRRDGNGFVWNLEIYDRRWKWAFGQISGCYNQIDRHNMLIPWTVRSPYELAVECLIAMGETTWDIDLPGGLTKQDGIDYASKQGVIFAELRGLTPTTGTNPPINWVQENPASALANLCELFGRRVIYRWSTNSVMIARQGVGQAIPSDGSIAADSPSIDPPEVPTGIAVAGAPTRYQVELLLEAVGEDWDGQIKPIDRLTYAPVGSVSQSQIVRLSIADPQPGERYEIFINAAPGEPLTSGTRVFFDVTSETAAQVAESLVGLIDDEISGGALIGLMHTIRSGRFFSLISNFDSRSFTVFARVTPTGFGGAINWWVQRQSDTMFPRWTYSSPSHFADAVETPRLKKIEAMRLAQKCVFRYYRITEVMTDGTALRIPPYGEIERRQQIVLTGFQVDQVVPEVGDESLVDWAGNPVTINYYNGFSRDKPAEVLGSVAKAVEQSAGKNKIDSDVSDPNTPYDFGDLTIDAAGNVVATPKRVNVDFQIDPERQMIIFDRPVYQIKNPAGIMAPVNMRLRTSVLIRNKDNNALECYSRSMLLPNQSGNTNYAIRKYHDVQQEYVVKYLRLSVPIGFKAFDLDAQSRADYYLDAMLKQYLVEAGQIREYNGIRQIDCDGAIQQVTWEISNGCKTTASMNTEHSIYVPPHPVRRRNEGLASVSRVGPGGLGAVAAANGEGARMDMSRHQRDNAGIEG